MSKKKSPAVPTTGCLHQCLIRSFCIAKLQRALVLLFHRNTALLVLAEPLQLYTNAHSAAFAVQNCSEHSFYCFTGVPTPGCSQNPSSYTQMPLTQLLRSKTAASTCFTVSQVFQRQGARRTPPAIHQCPFRSFCSAKLQRALVLLFHRNTALLVLAFPGLRQSQNQCFVKHFSCKLHTNWHVIF